MNNVVIKNQEELRFAVIQLDGYVKALSNSTNKKDIAEYLSTSKNLLLGIGKYVTDRVKNTENEKEIK